jgi:hypothetical protein
LPRSGEKDPQIVGDGSGFLVQLWPGDPGRPIPGNLEIAVAQAIPGEGRAGSVSLEAVELDREADVGPEAVDLVAAIANLDMGIEPGAWQAEAIEEGDESLLELTAGDATWKIAMTTQALSDGTRSTSARISSEEVGEREGVIEAPHLRLPHASLDGAQGQD